MTNVGAVAWCKVVLHQNSRMLQLCIGGPQPNTTYSTQAAINAALTATVKALAF